jgi:hypothetical protein
MSTFFSDLWADYGKDWDGERDWDYGDYVQDSGLEDERDAGLDTDEEAYDLERQYQDHLDYLAGLEQLVDCE